MFIFSEFLQYVINGLAQGSIYALIALGYTMVYGILKMINFAHGEFYMVGAFFGFWVFSSLGLPFWMGIPVVMLGSGLLAVLVERLAYRPLRGSNRIAPLITALGVSIVLVETTRVIATAQPRGFPQVVELPNLIFSEDHPFLADVTIQGGAVLVLVVSLVLMGLLRWIVMATSVGRAMRALSVDFDASKLMGVPINKIIALTFFMGSSLAGVAGVLVGMYFNQIEPYMGQLAGLKAFTAAVLGGIGNIPGAVLGAFALGICEELVVGYGASSYRDAIAFGILIFVLMVRPWGLLGTPEKVKV
jgi:branched-chain amino acid transport system permease protein